MTFVPGGPDVALVALPGGKVDLVLDRAGPNKGNVRFDRTAAHPLFSRIFSRKGLAYWDASGQRGTQVYTVKDDRTGTPSRLHSYVEDGCGQAKALRLISAYRVKVSKPGRFYQIDVEWQVPGLQKPQGMSAKL